MDRWKDRAQGWGWKETDDQGSQESFGGELSVSFGVLVLQILQKHVNVLLGLLLGPWMRSETKDYQSLHFITSKEFFSTQKTDGYMKSRLSRSLWSRK